MTVTHVTGVTGFPTCINCDRKHSLSNREEKLGFGETVRCFFSMLLHVEKPVTPVTLARSTGTADSRPSLQVRGGSAPTAGADIYIAEELSFFLHCRKAAWSPFPPKRCRAANDCFARTNKNRYKLFWLPAL